MVANFLVLLQHSRLPMKIYIFILMLILLTLGCKTRFPISDSPEVSPLENFNKKTTLAINFTMDKDELESYLDKYLDETFAEPIELRKYGVNINISRFASLGISIEDKKLLFEIPLILN